MTIGPVSYAIIGFPGNDFTGDIAPALANLVDNKTIRILDLLFVGKDPDGNILTFEFDALDALASYGALDGEAGGIISEADIDHAATALERNSSAAVLVWEDVWATELADAILACGGELLESARIPHALADAAFAALPAAV